MYDRPYLRVHDLLSSLGGNMVYKAGGGPGGVWELELRGRQATVPVRDNRVNALDRLYVADIPNPTTWDDYGEDSDLVADAFWRLLSLFGERS